MKKYFGEYNIKWSRVIIFAVITAVYTAIINLMPFLKETSFQDIAISLECWILFAVFIIVNCKKWWEASLKCFVFFLISQPLIYLIEVPFNSLGWGIFQYYKYWFIMTVLTLPGATVAFQLKKKNWLSVLVLSVVTIFLSYMTVEYFNSARYNFPHHLLSAVFCLVLAIFLIIILLDKKKYRIAALTVVLIVLIATFAYTAREHYVDMYLDEGNWTYTMENKSIVDIKIENGNYIMITSKHDGDTFIHFNNTDGSEREYSIVVSGGSISLLQVDDD
ncbi:hypothetical protein DIC82_11625 [Clostridium beijerinckii]|nr:hypothetical protein DIC82_11625 [Clostridium beijerinckii]